MTTKTSWTREERVQSSYDFALTLLEREPNRYNSDRLESGRELALNEAEYDMKTRKYGTTVFDCFCIDETVRHLTCKHRMAMMLVTQTFT